MANMRKRGENSWTFTVDIGVNANGSKIREFKTIKVTDPTLLRAPKRLQDYLDTELAHFKVQALSGSYRKPGKLKLSEFLNDWESSFVNVHLEEKTKDNYKFHSKTRITPYFGHMTMDQIKTIHILKFLETLRGPNARLDGKGPLKSATIVYNYRVLKSIFSKAVEWKVLVEDPMTGVKKPKEDDIKEMEIYDEKEIKQLFTALETESLQLRTYVTLAVTTGMRRGEIAGLEWNKVDTITGHLVISQSVPKLSDGLPVIKAPKNNKTRRIALSETVLSELRSLRAERESELAELLDKPVGSEDFFTLLQSTELWADGNHSFIFCHPDGKPYDPQTFTDWWIDFHRRHKLKPIRLHDLRHTSVSWMIYKKVHSEAIAKRVGHSNIKMLEIYGHIFESVDQAAASVFDDMKD